MGQLAKAPAGRVRRVREAIQLRNLLAGMATPLAEAMFEKATYRQWVCPMHGPIGLAVNALNQCVQETGYRDETVDQEDDEGNVQQVMVRRQYLCGEACERTGPLIATVKEIAAGATFASRVMAVKEHVMQKDGLNVDSAPPPQKTIVNIEHYHGLPLEERLKRIEAEVKDIPLIQPATLPEKVKP